MAAKFVIVGVRICCNHRQRMKEGWVSEIAHDDFCGNSSVNWKESVEHNFK